MTLPIRSRSRRGNCDEKNPGKFRVELPPGRYVVRGPGGSHPVEVKTGAWTQSIQLAPWAGISNRQYLIGRLINAFAHLV